MSPSVSSKVAWIKAHTASSSLMAWPNCREVGDLHHLIYKKPICSYFVDAGKLFHKRNPYINKVVYIYQICRIYNARYSICMCMWLTDSNLEREGGTVVPPNHDTWVKWMVAGRSKAGKWFGRSASAFQRRQMGSWGGSTSNTKQRFTKRRKQQQRPRNLKNSFFR